MTPYTLRLARASMRLPHESALAGVPDTYDWHAGPKEHAGLTPPPAMRAVTGWGQAFVAAKAERMGAILEVRDMQTWARVDGRWVLLQNLPVEGALYRADFSGNVSHSRFLPGKASDSIAVKAGEAAHWWPVRRAVLPAGITGLVVSFKARASRAQTLLAGAGADYWLSLSAPWVEGQATNPPVGTGRLRWVNTRWATFAMGL